MSSVGWLGAVGVFLALSVVGLVSKEAEVVRAAYIAMESIGWFVLVPLSILSLVSGLVQSLGTKWGLLRHYWVISKLLINLLATVVLLLYMRSLGFLADRAEQAPVSGGDLSALRSPSPVLHAGVALALLSIAAILSIYKPRGMTRYGRRKQQEPRAA
ncbi:MAG: DUF2269 domain-containing protein [Solirubrobacterales bacterium]